MHFVVQVDWEVDKPHKKDGSPVSPAEVCDWLLMLWLLR